MGKYTGKRRIYLYGHPDKAGYLMAEGPEQSEVKWDNGNEVAVPNTWIRFEPNEETPSEEVATPGSKPEAKQKTKFEPSAKIKVLIDYNPHRADSKDFNKFKKITAKMTVANALEAGIDQGYLNYGVKRKILSIQ